MVPCWEVLVHLKKESLISAYASGGFLLLSVDKFVQKKLTLLTLCNVFPPVLSICLQPGFCLHRHCLCQGRQESPRDLFFIPFADTFIDLLDPSFPSPWTSSLIQLAMCLLYSSPNPVCLLRCLIKPVVSETEATPLLFCQLCFPFLSQLPELREWQLHIPGLRKLCPSLPLCCTAQEKQTFLTIAFMAECNPVCPTEKQIYVFLILSI